MANSKTKTLWTLNGRAPDSRDILDDNGGLRRGRVDIDGSLMVHVEGYSKITYLRTTSDGEVGEYTSIMEALTLYGTDPVVETKPGSGIMTFFVDSSAATYPGIFQIDVVKEWEEEDPEAVPGDSIEGIRLWSSPVNLGVAVKYKGSESETSFTFDSGLLPFRLGDHFANATAARRKNGAKYVVHMVDNLDAKDLAALKEKLGGGGSGGTDFTPAEKVPTGSLQKLEPMPETPTSLGDEAAVLKWMNGVVDMLKITAANDNTSIKTVNDTIRSLTAAGIMKK